MVKFLIIEKIGCIPILINDYAGWYAKIEEDFTRIWGEFYGGKTRGKKLEVDRKDNQEGYTLENCVLSYSICNNAKSDKFTDTEFKKLGKSIKQVYRSRNKRD